MRWYLLILCSLLTGCAGLGDLRFSYDFAQKQFHVSVPLQKPIKDK
jgi:hypothetical protein